MTELLTDVGPIEVSACVNQVPIPRLNTTLLLRAPPVTVVANGVESSTVVTVPARKTRKTKIVGAVTVTIPSSCSFKVFTLSLAQICNLCRMPYNKSTDYKSVAAEEFTTSPATTYTKY